MNSRGKMLLVFCGFTHDSQSVLAAIYGLALMGVELCLNIGIAEFGAATFADPKPLFYDPQFALRHDCSLAQAEGTA